MQNDVTDDFIRILMWHVMIECWYEYLTYKKNDLVNILIRCWCGYFTCKRMT
jgi:hypothetical protein